ncbi:TetR/AcrR family transcriptional regulator [Myxococcota bacterium]|nr:TetR/AcrR family transcriptional regulator [Myxococcota bacterium]
MASADSTKRAPSADVAADRRKQILQAAVEVFAERGFHRTRVSDIAKRAGVAYGLIYHYFDSKDDVLSSVFEDNWAVFVKVLREFEHNPELGAIAKLEAIAALLIDALRIAPRIIQVIIQEISRSDRFVQAKKVAAFQEAFGIVRAIIIEGQKSGELKADLEPLVAAYMFFGALETICTGFLLKAIPCSTDSEAEAVKRTIREVMLAGLVAPRP